MRGHRQVSRYVACWTGRLCCHSSSVYVIMYLWEVIKYSTTIMARSSQFAWFYCRVLFFQLAQSAFSRLAASFGSQTVFENFPNKRQSVVYVLTEGVEEESSKDHEEADGDADNELAQVPCAHCLPNHGAQGLRGFLSAWEWSCITWRPFCVQ